MIIKTKALVMREYIVGESDKYVTLFTKEHGKLQALAPKAKKADRGFASSTQLFVYGDFILTSFNDTYRLVGAEIIEMFHDIRNNLEALSYASYFMEYLQAVTEPNLPHPQLLRLSLMALKALCHEGASMHLIRRVFELRSLKELGFMPEIISCTECGEVLNEDEKMTYYFSAQAGGSVCSECKKAYVDVVKLCYSTRYTMLYILSAPMNKLFHFKVTKNVEKELAEICNRYVPYYIDKQFKTLDFLERIEGLT